MNSKLAKILLLNAIVTATVVLVVGALICNKKPSAAEPLAASPEDKVTMEATAKTGDLTGVVKMATNIHSLEMNFISGYMRIDYNSSAGELNWDCDGEGANLFFNSDPKTGKGVLNFSAPYLDCDISVPNKPFFVRGANGKVEIRQIRAPLDVTLSKGTVYLEPVAELSYNYQITAGVPEPENAPPGDVDRLEAHSPFVSSNQADSIPVKIVVKSGAVLPLSEAEDTE